MAERITGNTDMMCISEIYTKMQDDAKNNSIHMFNASDNNVNNMNMFTFFCKFIKKYIVITKSNDDIVNV